jgi:hypothetical protein
MQENLSILLFFCHLENAEKGGVTAGMYALANTRHQ